MLQSKRRCCQNKSEASGQRRRRKAGGFPGPQLGWPGVGPAGMVMVTLVWGWRFCWVRTGNHCLEGMVRRGNPHPPVLDSAANLIFSMH